LRQAGIDIATTPPPAGAFRPAGVLWRDALPQAALSVLQMRKNLGGICRSTARLSLPLAVLVLKRAPGAGGRHASLKEVYS